MSNDRYYLTSDDIRQQQRINRAVAELIDPAPVVNRRRILSSSVTASAEQYHGYFTIIDASSEEEKKIMVIDGDTWNDETQTSGPSICRVNSSVYQVNAWTSAAITGRFYVILQYHADGTTEGVKIRLLQAIPPDRMTIKFYQIGEVYLQDGALKIIQRHTTGGITLTGGLSTAAFGISPIFAEPPETGVFPETTYTIRVNAGTVQIGTSSVNIARQDFTSLSATGNNYIYLTVTYSNGYSALLGCYTSAPSPGVPNWICQVGRCSAALVDQSVSGNIRVTGVWV